MKVKNLVKYDIRVEEVRRHLLAHMPRYQCHDSEMVDSPFTSFHDEEAAATRTRSDQNRRPLCEGSPNQAHGKKIGDQQHKSGKQMTTFLRYNQVASMEGQLIALKEQNVDLKDQMNAAAVAAQQKLVTHIESSTVQLSALREQLADSMEAAKVYLEETMLAAAVAAQQKLDKQDEVSRTRLAALREQLAASEQANAEMLEENHAAAAAAQQKLEKQHEVSATQLAGLTEQLAGVKAKAVNAAVAMAQRRRSVPETVDVDLQLAALRERLISEEAKAELRTQINEAAAFAQGQLAASEEAKAEWQTQMNEAAALREQLTASEEAKAELQTQMKEAAVFAQGQLAASEVAKGQLQARLNEAQRRRSGHDTSDLVEVLRELREQLGVSEKAKTMLQAELSGVCAALSAR